MSAQVVCPHCNKSIKLKDRSLLGKKGKCPSCAKSFLIQEQAAAEEVVPLQLVGEEPAVGTGAMWVPDDPVLPVAADMPVAYVPVQTPQGVVLQPVMGGAIPGYPAVSSALPPAPAFNFDLGDDTPLPPSAATPAATSSIKRPARKTRSNNSTLIGVGVAAVILVGGGLYFGFQTSSTTVTMTPDTPVLPAGTEVPAEVSPPGAYSRESLTADPALVEEFRPTKGGPIPLNMLTGSNNILIHLRPGRIWGTERAAAELKASLTEDVVTWLETTIKKITHRNPDQIDDLLIGLSVVSKSEPPQISTVFRLKKPEKRSALVLEFNGTEVSLPGRPLVTRKDALAFHVKDDRTIAISPAELANDLAEAVAKPQECVTDGIQALLKASDRERSFTVFFDVTDATTYSSQLFEPSVEPACLKLLEWFGPDADTVSWSLHLDQTLHSQLRIYPKGGHTGTGKISTPDTLKRDFPGKLTTVVEKDLVGAVRVMRPNRSGFRQIIGRFPAMVEAFRQATIFQAEPKFLTMTTVLPAKAGPNLALGAVLTWDESTRTDFRTSDSATPVATGEENLPKTVLGRLKTELEIEFSRKPLEEAFLFIGDETKVTFVVDGDALKQAGYTKNIPQTFKLGKVPGTQGLYTILTWPMQEKMCLVVDDAKMEAHITTTAAAQAQGLKIVPVESLK